MAREVRSFLPLVHPVDGNTELDHCHIKTRTLEEFLRELQRPIKQDFRLGEPPLGRVNDGQVLRDLCLRHQLAPPGQAGQGRPSPDEAQFGLDEVRFCTCLCPCTLNSSAVAPFGGSAAARAEPLSTVGTSTTSAVLRTKRTMVFEQTVGHIA